MSVLASILGHWATARRDGDTCTSQNPAKWLIDCIVGPQSSSGVAVNAASALKYAPFWAAVRIISGTLAALPFKVYRHLDAGGKEAKPKHRVYRLLHDTPNEYMSALKFIETRQAHVLCYGNGYAEIQRDGAGRPIALWPLLPDKTTRKLREDGTPYYEVRVTLPSGATETVNLPDENVLHIMGLGFDGYTGYDVVTYHREAIGYGIGVKEYGARFFANGAAPGGVLEHPNTLSDKAKRFLVDSWNTQHQGLSQAHRLQILEEGMKWQGTGVDPQKAQALEVQKWNVDDCARIFQIPPHMLGSMEFSKYNNVEQLRLDFYCTTMLYWFRTWEQEVNRKLFMPSEQGTMFAEILADAMLRGDADSRAKYYASGRQWGYLSINDIRGKENMNPIGPDGDVYLDPLNMVPAGSLKADSDNIGPWNDSVEPGEGPDDGKGKEKDSIRAVRAAHRELLITQCRRIVTKQINATRDRTQSEAWWENHRRWAGDVLGGAVTAYAQTQGNVVADGALTRVVVEWFQESMPMREDIRDALAEIITDDLIYRIDQIGGKYA